MSPVPRIAARGAPVAFVAWAPVAGRSNDVADALGGVAWCDYDPRWRGWRAPPRYLRSMLRQAVWLLRERPQAVIATNPPIFCGLGAYGYARLAGVPFVLDSHPIAFEDRRAWIVALTAPVHRALARRAAVVLVTTDALAVQVQASGGRALLLHEPPAALHARPRPPRERPLLAFLGTFASDEPVAEVIDAARRVPGVDVAVTGAPDRAPAGLVDGAPANVRFTGWLDPADYRELLRQATAAIVLTTRPTSVMRAAYETVYAGRPLITSDTPTLRALFPDAVHVAGSAGAIARAVTDVAARLECFDARTETARSRQLRRWQAQLTALQHALGGRPSAPDHRRATGPPYAP